MRSAPAVRYPVGAAFWQMAALALPWALAAAVCALWALQPAAPRWAAALALACAVVAALGLWWGRHRGGAGVLHWDGRSWTLQTGQGPARAGALVLALDGQTLMLLVFRPLAGGTRWLWLRRGADAARWADLRRAVYATHGVRAPSATHGAAP